MTPADSFYVDLGKGIVSVLMAIGLVFFVIYVAMAALGILELIAKSINEFTIEWRARVAARAHQITEQERTERSDRILKEFMQEKQRKEDELESRKRIAFSSETRN